MKFFKLKRYRAWNPSAMAELIYTRDNLRNLVQLSSLINSSLETQEALNNALMSVEQSLNAEVSSII